jgi:WD40 repeat protein
MQVRTARLWDAETGNAIAVLGGHGSAVESAAFSPDGKRIVTASADKTARLWDAETGKPIGELKGNEGPVRSAAFSPDGKRIVTASSDGSVRLWDAETGKPIGELKGVAGGAETRVSFSPDGERIVVTAGYTARLLKLFANTQELVSYAKASIPRCLTVAQRNAFFLPPDPPQWCVELGKWR